MAPWPPYPAAVDVRWRHQHAARKREAARGGGGRLQDGPVRTGRGTCLRGPIWVARTAGGADDAASPGPMRREDGGGRHDRPFRRDEVLLRQMHTCNRTTVQGLRQ